MLKHYFNFLNMGDPVNVACIMWQNSSQRPNPVCHIG